MVFLMLFFKMENIVFYFCKVCRSAPEKRGGEMPVHHRFCQSAQVNRSLLLRSPVEALGEKVWRKPLLTECNLLLFFCR